MIFKVEYDRYFAGAHNFQMNNPQFNNNNYYTKTPGIDLAHDVDNKNLDINTIK